MKREYRGITWIKGNGQSLSRALGKNPAAFNSYKHEHPNITEEQYIDFVLNKEEKVTYRGITWIKGNGQSLCRALGKAPATFTSYKSNHPNITEEQYIDFVLDSGYKEYFHGDKEVTYRGITFSTQSSLARHFHISKQRISDIMKKHDFSNLYDVVDYMLDRKPVEDYSKKKYEKVTYRDITWLKGNESSLSRALGKSPAAFTSYKKTHPEVTEEQYIDHCLDKKEISYQGITWIKGNISSLCRALGKSPVAFNSYKSNHPNITEEQYIDHCLNR